MSLQTVSDLQTELLVRNNRTTTDGFITDAMLQDWTRNSNTYCTTYKKWPFSEVRDQTTSWSGTEEVDYASFLIDFKADAIRTMFIGGKQVFKRNFEDYLDFRQNYPSSNDRIFADFGRILYINPIADVSGTMAVFGQATPKIDPTDLTATTIFSNYDEEGNEAIIQKMKSYLKEREHLPDEAVLANQETDNMLEKL